MQATAWVRRFPAKQGSTGKPRLGHSGLEQNSFFVTCLSPSLPPASFHSPGRGLGLSLPLGFCERQPADSAFWGQKAAWANTPAQLRVSPQKEGQRTKEVQGSCAALLGWEIGIPQQREEKTGRRLEYIITKQLPAPPPPFSKF